MKEDKYPGFFISLGKMSVDMVSCIIDGFERSQVKFTHKAHD